MKILAINASHRGDAGHTDFLIDKLFQGATKAGADCELITLTKFKINRCLACEKCHTPEQHLRCVYDDKDSVRTIFNQMASLSSKLRKCSTPKSNSRRFSKGSIPEYRGKFGALTDWEKLHSG